MKSGAKRKASRRSGLPSQSLYDTFRNAALPASVR